MMMMMMMVMMNCSCGMVDRRKTFLVLQFNKHKACNNSYYAEQGTWKQQHMQGFRSRGDYGGRDGPQA